VPIVRFDQALPGDSLPTYLTRFVGRSAELSRLTELVGSARLVTICGIGGAGKSRLSVEFARLSGIDPRCRFSDGVVWVPMVAVTEPGDLPDALAPALGLREAAGGRPLVALQRSLADRHLLLVLTAASRWLPLRRPDRRVVARLPAGVGAGDQ
jgi:hypothetical protein